MLKILETFDSEKDCKEFTGTALDPELDPESGGIEGGISRDVSRVRSLLTWLPKPEPELPFLTCPEILISGIVPVSSFCSGLLIGSEEEVRSSRSSRMEF